MIPDPAGEEPEPEPMVRIRPYLRAAGGSRPPAATPVPSAYPGSVAPTAPRPFVLTAGRVAGADPAIGLETQVTARSGGGPDPGVAHRLPPELQAIVSLCGAPISVAEISAKTRMHFGVTRVLVGDLRAAGLLDVHVATVAEAHDPDLILRLIDGLRAIS
ncbi:DUF742 domain-containing protein [Micromonospora sp. NPDC000089]|uniref:DUF742 domain-containing protein n=1 Tax=unclassified Micromonospora TaxID=2617518 RepID=UPI0036843D46